MYVLCSCDKTLQQQNFCLYDSLITFILVAICTVFHSLWNVKILFMVDGTTLNEQQKYQQLHAVSEVIRSCQNVHTTPVWRTLSYIYGITSLLVLMVLRLKHLFMSTTEGWDSGTGSMWHLIAVKLYRNSNSLVKLQTEQRETART